MTSIKAKFRPSASPDGMGTVYYQLICERVVRQIATPYRIFPAEWDSARSAVKTATGSPRHEALAAIREAMVRDMERLVRISRRLADQGYGCSADDIAAEFRRQWCECTLFAYMEARIAALRLNGRVRTSETYSSALASFRKFRDGCDIMLDSISPVLMESYGAWLRQKGLVPNTVSFYARILRAVYNRAVDEGITDDRRPFRHVYTGIDRTVRRALPLAAIRRIKNLDLSRSPRLDFARDVFMLSFCLRGMSFIDMAFLRKTDLRDGHVTYRRRKTGQLLTIAWTPAMQSFLDKHPSPSGPYLLPVIPADAPDGRKACHTACGKINLRLKAVARLAGIPGSLTLYVARHSWASAARAKGIPLAVISEGLGHDSEATTQIYLASLSSSAVDRANAFIIKSLQ